MTTTLHHITWDGLVWACPFPEADGDHNARDEVHLLVRRYIEEHKLDPTKDYRQALGALFEADPELKEVYSRS